MFKDMFTMEKLKKLGMNLIPLVIQTLLSVLALSLYFGQIRNYDMKLTNFIDEEFLFKFLFSEIDNLFLPLVLILLLITITNILIKQLTLKKTLNFKLFLKDSWKHLLANFSSMLLWVFIFIIAFLFVMLIAVPAIAILLPLLEGSESLVPYALGIWIVTLFIYFFIFLRYTMLIRFLYVDLTMYTKNVFSAIFHASLYVKSYFWILIWYSVLLFANTMGKIGVFSYILYNNFFLQQKTDTRFYILFVFLNITGYLLKRFIYSYYNKKAIPDNELEDTYVIYEEIPKEEYEMELEQDISNIDNEEDLEII